MGGARSRGLLALLGALALGAVVPSVALAADPSGCDPLDPAVCLQPWPNDYFTQAAPTNTGLRLDIERRAMPRNRLGIPIDPADYNRANGFSPGASLITKVPGLTSQAALAVTGAVPITDLDRYLDPDAPIVVINADTGERHPIWAEIDANARSPSDRNVIIRPAVNFDEGTRYVVALRNLKRKDSTPIVARRAFRVYRDSIPTEDPAVEARRPHMEDLFATLGDAGIAREGLYLAWDFTVASERNLTEHMLSIRDRAFADLGDTNLADLKVAGRSPRFIVTGVTRFSPDAEPNIARRIKGQLIVPCYLNLPGCPPGAKFFFSSQGDLSPNRIPGNVTLAGFECLIPRSATDGPGTTPARPSLYGHGLLGDAGEVEAGNVKAMANEHNFLFCATDWAGFAFQDVPVIGLTLQDLSHAGRFVDRTQQGFLNQLFLGRAMIHPHGFVEDPAFRVGGEPVIKTKRLFYDGNSQGGILGGALTAIAPDFDRAVLGVPGMNYSTLLTRSVDFIPYAEGKFCGAISDACEDLDSPFGLYDNYPNELERPLLFALIQTLWDRSEANGYAHHITADPLRNTPAHEVLMHVAFGDHQVTNVAADVEARTIGAYAHTPALDSGRIPGIDPLWQIPGIPAYPFGGSAIVYWDSGPPRPGDEGVFNPPTLNVPPPNGRDPHSDPRNTFEARIQKSAFLAIGGMVVDVCGGEPCYSHGWTGP